MGLPSHCYECGREEARHCPRHCPLWEAQHRLRTQGALALDIGEAEWTWLLPLGVRTGLYRATEPPYRPLTFGSV